MLAFIQNFDKGRFQAKKKTKKKTFVKYRSVLVRPSILELRLHNVSILFNQNRFINNVLERIWLKLFVRCRRT